MFFDAPPCQVSFVIHCLTITHSPKMILWSCLHLFIKLNDSAGPLLQYSGVEWSGSLPLVLQSDPLKSYAMIGRILDGWTGQVSSILSSGILSSMRLKADLTLLIVSIFWGSAFVAQRVAGQMGSIYLFNGARYLLASVIVLPFALWAGQADRKSVV